MNTLEAPESMEFHYTDVDYLYDEFDESNFDSVPPRTTYTAETSISFVEITEACVVPTLIDVCSTYIPVLLLCLFFQFMNKFS